MSTMIRSTEAAELLGVSTATLYAYVSRGRLHRTTAPDGRTSLFRLDDVEALSARSRRSAPGPRPTIEVQIRSGITTMHEDALEFRGHDVVGLVRHHRFEDVAELLWSPGGDLVDGVEWPAPDRNDLDAVAAVTTIAATPIGRIAITCHVLDALHPSDDASSAARRLLGLVPAVFGSSRRTGRYAQRLATAWRRRPSPELVTAIDTALGLLADHELATSALAARVAASTRTSPYAAIAAGLATIEGHLHGCASAEVHRFLDRCASEDPGLVVAELRSRHQPVPGFGHKVYRGVDPRYGPLIEAARPLDPESMAVVDAVVAEVGRTLPHQPNVDLALGALTRAAGLEPGTPIFAVARIAGLAAHAAEELDEPPLRFRGVARPR
jgi:citrate synthase